MYLLSYNHVRRSKGFTVAELLIALIITSVVLAAVATLAYAAGSASDSTEDMNATQREVRYATLRIRELITHCRKAIVVSSDEMAIWTVDDNGDNRINGSELVYILFDSPSSELSLTEFPSQGLTVTIGDILAANALTDLVAVSNEQVTVLSGNCSNATFAVNARGLVNISVTIVDNGIATDYQVAAVVRGSAANLLSAGEIVATGDDD